MPVIKPVGDCALTVEFENEASIAVNRKVHELDRRLQEADLPALQETVPTYRTLIVYYKPELAPYAQMAAQVEALCQKPFAAEGGSGLVVELPVLYGGEVPLAEDHGRYDGWDGGETAPDMEAVMAHEGLSREEVIEKHSSNLSYVYFQTFAVGHSQLGSANPTFTISRRATPRTLVPQGSIAIWASQTVLNGFDLPCGWQVIGRTPVLLHDDRKDPPGYCQPGNWVKFVPITREEYLDIYRRSREGSYQPVTYPLEGGEQDGN